MNSQHIAASRGGGGGGLVAYVYTHCVILFKKDPGESLEIQRLFDISLSRDQVFM